MLGRVMAKRDTRLFSGSVSGSKNAIVCCDFVHS